MIRMCWWVKVHTGYKLFKSKGISLKDFYDTEVLGGGDVKVHPGYKLFKSKGLNSKGYYDMEVLGGKCAPRVQTVQVTGTH